MFASRAATPSDYKLIVSPGGQLQIAKQLSFGYTLPFAMRAEQSVKRDDSGRESCPLCGSTNAQAVTRTTLCVYLRCEKCQHVWTVPERRSVPRATETSRLF